MKLVFARTCSNIEEVWLGNDILTAEVQFSASIHFIQIKLFIMHGLYFLSVLSCT
jgi:hypothetical protein